MSADPIVAAVAALALAAAAIVRRRSGRRGGERFWLPLIAGIGLFVFVAYAVAITNDPGPTGLDKSVIDMADDLHSSTGLDMAKVVTAFGSLPVTAAFVIAAAVALAIRRRRVELAVLVGSFVAVYLAVHVVKAAVDRPRPPRPLAHASLSAFPSGHAAYSTVYVALTVIAGRMFERVASRAALVIAGILAAGAIGASRAYLRVHWWSDVLAGWALGVAIFAAVAATGVVVGYFRNNPRGMSAAQSAGGDAPRP